MTAAPGLTFKPQHHWTTKDYSCGRPLVLGFVQLGLAYIMHLSKRSLKTELPTSFPIPLARLGTSIISSGVHSDFLKFPGSGLELSWLVATGACFNDCFMFFISGGSMLTPS